MTPLTPEETWLLQFTQVHGTPTGAPWGDGTAMARRQANNQPPWDANCRVTTLVGGFAAMSAMRDALERLINEGQQALASGKKAGECGYVYMCDWRLNAFRDTSSANVWSTTRPWNAGDQAAKDHDQTVIGLILRLMQAGVQVRILLWLPPTSEFGFDAHLEDHFYTLLMVQHEDARLRKGKFKDARTLLGAVALDRRVAAQPTATHHQKMMVIQGLSFQVAFCGGVDLAYTRRDAPLKPESWRADPPQILGGDWQSGEAIPDPQTLWPLDPSGDYNVNAEVHRPRHRQSSDLVAYVYGDGKSPDGRQFWHDQHLQLEGPIVTTLEEQFRERWSDTVGLAGPLVWDLRLPDPAIMLSDLVLLSTTDALDLSTRPFKITPLRPATPAPAAAGEPGFDSTVQMWRTIPWRAERAKQKAPYLTAGEFTVMAGYAKACQAATELIWIFDQYFWSRPLARLLNARLKKTKSLRLVMILPPYADQDTIGLDTVAHHARQLALEALTDGLSQSGGEFDQVAVYNLWLSRFPREAGIYCHAKTQTYDGSLLVCGSANLNRRSLMGDSELACAVLNPRVVNEHQHKLWSLLFADEPWPQDSASHDVVLTDPGSGATFFSALTQKAKSAKSLLIPDPWRKGASARLPNGVTRQQDPFATPFQAGYDNALETTSIDLAIEAPIYDGAAPDGLREPDLSEIVHRLSVDSRSEHDGELSWSFRRPPAPVTAPWAL